MDTFLIVQRGEDIGKRYDLDTVQLTVGRGADNDMVLNDPMVSRYHAVVKRQGGGFAIIDLGSANPVVINDRVLEPGLPHQLQHRDVVFIGKTVFSFQVRGQG
ncbi:MAG: FHA domain-containing protein, partial [Chloroflexota bacterium]|nr:FHA domain-containing protein [Chloroflexota bacterium]